MPEQVGFDITCLSCGVDDGIVLHLHSLVFKCEDCETTWTLDEVEALLKDWRQVVDWVKTAPPLQTQK